MQSSFVLLALLAMWTGIQSRDVRRWAAAGIAAAAAFLIKESTIQLAPLGVVAALALPSQRTREGMLGAITYTAAFALAISPWWVWVFIQTSDLFLLGDPGRAATEAAILVAVAVAAAIVLRTRKVPPSTGAPAAIALVVVWGAFLLYGLTKHSGWPYPNEYHSTIPRYMLQVAPQMQPYFPIVAAWVWVGWQAWRGDERARLLFAAAALFAPFALFAANRWLQLRDALPLVYLSYIVLGLAAADLWGRIRPHLVGAVAMQGALAAAALLAVALAAHQAHAFNAFTERERVASQQAGSWNSPYTREVAAWMRTSIPAGSRIMTSRQYFTGLHVETGARFSIRQLPTVRVDVTGGDPLVHARGNLFRWEDTQLRPTRAGDTWLHLQQFPNKGYWVGLNQQELLEFVEAHDIEYVVLTGDDVAFSSSAYAWYFTANPAFQLLETIAGTGGDRMFAYKVDHTRMDTISHSTSIHPRSAAALEQATGLSPEELSSALGTKLRVTDRDGQLSDRELNAALAGSDLGAKSEAQ
jgi:hypothetical protein